MNSQTKTKGRPLLPEIVAEADADMALVVRGKITLKEGLVRIRASKNRLLKAVSKLCHMEKRLEEATSSGMGRHHLTRDARGWQFGSTGRPRSGRFSEEDV